MKIRINCCKIFDVILLPKKETIMIDTGNYRELRAFAAYFDEISRVPRVSGITDHIAKYLTDFAKAHGLEYYRDASDNVIIKKPSTAGRKTAPTVILQGHTDMVPAGSPEGIAKLKTEGVKIIQDGDIIRADGTTLGADNGVAVAYMLAILESKDISHPALECVFTSNEETGLNGAADIEAKLLSGRIMINLDAGGDGLFVAGCAGGLRANVSMPVRREAASGSCYKIAVSGFLGGHSGCDIDKCRENAIKALADCLYELGEVRIADFSGGSASNAIPARAEATVICDKTASEIGEMIAPVFEKYKKAEPEGRISVDTAFFGELALDADSTDKLLSLIHRQPTGIVAMSEDIEGLVKTSRNVGTARLADSSLELVVSIRSPLEESRLAVLSEVEAIGAVFNATVTSDGDYPGWAYRKVSHLRDTCCESHKELFGSSPTVVTIHAGLECGLFSSKLEGLDCISMGPDTYEVHTVNEWFSLRSAERFWKLLIKVLEKI